MFLIKSNRSDLFNTFIVNQTLDNANSSHPERHSAVIAHELSRLNIDIAVLSEFCHADEGSLQEAGAGFTLFWSGKSSTDRHLSGYILADEGSLQEAGAGFTRFWSGKPSTDRRLLGYILADEGSLQEAGAGFTLFWWWWWWCRPHPVREHAQDLRPPLGARPASPPTRQAAQLPPRGPSTNPRPLV